ncbi:hypothetical protein FORC54_3090 [Vibrio vulnificus]|jgi:hypothetical protein|nr:hypothetical protein FORC54_3090 [Vibrio vulnificus]
MANMTLRLKSEFRKSIFVNSITIKFFFMKNVAKYCAIPFLPNDSDGEFIDQIHKIGA